ncbi:hypothetical protein BD310DRAFT_940776 [Dichomitus squalens]|uniref:Uncharacterized protein n=1 Tax=Dichomitus squalens TaxID=114155 RepID=A0A4Q9PBT5_9APHY|nr:hypothetical protein BD310DRAFT_940776 [Dichomitus squalens]
METRVPSPQTTAAALTAARFAWQITPLALSAPRRSRSHRAVYLAMILITISLGIVSSAPLALAFPFTLVCRCAWICGPS